MEKFSRLAEVFDHLFACVFVTISCLIRFLLAALQGRENKCS